MIKKYCKEINVRTRSLSPGMTFGNNKKSVRRTAFRPRLQLSASWSTPHSCKSYPYDDKTTEAVSNQDLSASVNYITPIISRNVFTLNFASGRFARPSEQFPSVWYWKMDGQRGHILDEADVRASFSGLLTANDFSIPWAQIQIQKNEMERLHVQRRWSG